VYRKQKLTQSDRVSETMRGKGN